MAPLRLPTQPTRPPTPTPTPHSAVTAATVSIQVFCIGVGEVPDSEPDRAVRHGGDPRRQRRELSRAACASGGAYASSHAEVEPGVYKYVYPVAW